mgnify:CR=1 FL=1
MNVEQYLFLAPRTNGATPQTSLYRAEAAHGAVKVRAAASTGGRGSPLLCCRARSEARGNDGLESERMKLKR